MEFKKLTDGQKALYSEIENLIIVWRIDGTKTAGHLTREIVDMLYYKRCKDKQLTEVFNTNQVDLGSQMLCHHTYIEKDAYWKSCTHCGMLSPLSIH